MNPAPSQRWFHWAGTVVEEAKMGWHVGKQGQKQALSDPKAGTDLEGPD